MCKSGRVSVSLNYGCGQTGSLIIPVGNFPNGSIVQTLTSFPRSDLQEHVSQSWELISGAVSNQI